MDRSKQDRELQVMLAALCAKDVPFFFNAFGWTYDPRRSPPDVPFILYPHEVNLLDWLEQRLQTQKDGLVEKSRDMGVTWVGMGWMLHHWLFHEGFHPLLGSRKEELVDQKGVIDTLFGKLRYLLYHLPPWMRPEGFRADLHDSYTRLINPMKSENVITGESTNVSFSRQGRYSVIWLDEFAHVEEADHIWQATADSAPVRFPVSTPKGIGNRFARLRHHQEGEQIDVSTLHWSRHPEKSKGLYCPTHGNPAPSSCQWPTCKLRSPWYDAECTRRSALEVAQELDIDYLGAGHPYFDLPALARVTSEPPKAKGRLIEVDRRVEFREDPQGPWLIWELPGPTVGWTSHPMVPAIIGADVAEGIGGDFSVAVVRDTKDRGLKALLRVQMDTDQFAYELAKAGWFYHQAKILCERNGPGFAVNVELRKYYGNLYAEVAVEQIGQPQTTRFGWNTNARTRELMLTQMREEIRQEACALRCEQLIEECRVFVVDDKGRAHADVGYHDDAVMAWAIAGQGIQLFPYRPLRLPKPQERPSETSLVG